MAGPRHDGQGGQQRSLVPGAPDALRDQCTARSASPCRIRPGLPGTRELNIARAGRRWADACARTRVTWCAAQHRRVRQRQPRGRRAVRRRQPDVVRRLRGDVPRRGVRRRHRRVRRAVRRRARPTARREASARPQCTEVVPALRIPGGGSTRTDCLLETAVDIADAGARSATACRRTSRVCVDNDPGCDFDPDPGKLPLPRLALSRRRGRRGSRARGRGRRRRAAQAEGDGRGRQLAALRQAIVERLGPCPCRCRRGSAAPSRIDVDVPAGGRAASCRCASAGRSAAATATSSSSSAWCRGREGRAAARSDRFEDRRGALAHAAADRREAVAPAAAAQLERRRADQARARGADRMTRARRRRRSD